MVKNTYGTGCFLLMHTGERPVHSRSKLLATVAWQKADRREFALEVACSSRAQPFNGCVMAWV
jgi:glycerol kinase